MKQVGVESCSIAYRATLIICWRTSDGQINVVRSGLIFLNILSTCGLL